MRLQLIALMLLGAVAMAAPTVEARHACETTAECLAGHPTALFCLLPEPTPWTALFETLCRTAG